MYNSVYAGPLFQLPVKLNVCWTFIYLYNSMYVGQVYLPVQLNGCWIFYVPVQLMLDLLFTFTTNCMLDLHLHVQLNVCWTILYLYNSMHAGPLCTCTTQFMLDHLFTCTRNVCWIFNVPAQLNVLVCWTFSLTPCMFNSMYVGPFIYLYNSMHVGHLLHILFASTA